MKVWRVRQSRTRQLQIRSLNSLNCNWNKSRNKKKSRKLTMIESLKASSMISVNQLLVKKSSSNKSMSFSKSTKMRCKILQTTIQNRLPSVNKISANWMRLCHNFSLNWLCSKMSQRKKLRLSRKIFLWLKKSEIDSEVKKRKCWRIKASPLRRLSSVSTIKLGRRKIY